MQLDHRAGGQNFFKLEISPNFETEHRSEENVLAGVLHSLFDQSQEAGWHFSRVTDVRPKLLGEKSAFFPALWVTKMQGNFLVLLHWYSKSWDGFLKLQGRKTTALQAEALHKKQKAYSRNQQLNYSGPCLW